MTEDLDSLGVSSNFMAGFKWDLKCTPGSMSAKTIVRRLRSCLHPREGISVPTSIHHRVLFFYELWDGAFGTTAIQNVYLYYMPVYEDDFFKNSSLTKKQCILAIISWGVPFVPFPAWTMYLIRQTVLRDSGVFATLRLKAARHKFFVSNCFLSDSRSILDLAIEESGDSSTDFRTSIDAFNTASSGLSEYSAISSKGSARRSRSASPRKRPSTSHRAPLPAPPVSPPRHRSVSPRRRSPRRHHRSASPRKRSASPRTRSRSRSADSSSSDSSSSSESSSSSSGYDSDRSAREHALRGLVNAPSSSTHSGSGSSKSKHKHKKSKKSKKSKKKAKDKKRKSSRVEGHHHYHTAVSELDKSIKRGSFIDFFAYTPARLDLLKQLGSSSKASSHLPGSNIWISTSAPAIPDPALVLRSKANLASGFYFYLSRLNVSRTKAHLSHDRVLWWSWLNTKFHDNDRALLYFACNFALKHHASNQWAIDAENASHLYSDAKMSCSSDVHDSKNSSGHKDRRDGKKLVVKRHSSSSSSKTSSWTPEQKKAIHAMSAQCPPKTCLSRIVKGYPCGAIKKGISCRFLHVCGWCKSATCEASCTKAPLSPL